MVYFHPTKNEITEGNKNKNLCRELYFNNFIFPVCVFVSYFKNRTKHVLPVLMLFETRTVHINIKIIALKTYRMCLTRCII